MAIQLQTWGEKLLQVQNAIEAVQASQRYEINGRSVQKADLEWLHKRELYLTGQYEKFGDVVIGSGVTRGAMRVEFE